MSGGCQSQFRVNLRRVGLAATLPLALQQRKWLQTGRHSRSVPRADLDSCNYYVLPIVFEQRVTWIVPLMSVIMASCACGAALHHHRYCRNGDGRRFASLRC